MARLPAHPSPTCLVVQHVEPEEPYAIATALAGAGVEVRVHPVFGPGPLPVDLDGIDALVVMGGPMSAAHDAGFPTRTAELSLLEQALDRGLPVLGVCLGAQLVAAAAGAPVYPGPAGPEIGWGPVTLSEEAGKDPLLTGLPESFDVLHWHGDTFDLPPEAVRLASNSRYANQAFRLGPAAWGFQFHLEVDAAAVAAFLSSFADEARAAGVEPEEIATATAAAVAALEEPRTVVLERFAALVGDSAQ